MYKRQFPSGWACAHSRPLWVSPTSSPVRLGVSPAAAPTPMGVFNQRFEVLFPRTGALGYEVCFAPHCSSRFICARVWGHGVLPTALPAPFSATLSPALSVYLCMNVGPQGLLVVRLPAPFVPHSASLGPATECESSPPRCPSPPLLPVWMYVYFLSTWCWTPLPFDFVSSGCARRRSVSTYAAILVLYCLDFQNPITKPLLNDPSRKVLRFYSHWFHPNFFNCFQDSVEWANKLPNTDQFCFFQSVVRHRSLFL